MVVDVVVELVVVVSTGATVRVVVVGAVVVVVVDVVVVLVVVGLGSRVTEICEYQYHKTYYKSLNIDRKQ